MAETAFLKKLAEEKTKAVNEMLALNLGNSHGLARLQGLNLGLTIAEQAYRAATKSDDEELLA